MTSFTQPFLCSLSVLAIGVLLDGIVLIGPVAADEQVQAIVRAGVNKGNSLLAHSQFKQAIEEYEKCLEIEPDNPYAKANLVLAHNNWGIAYFHQGKYDQAKEEWQAALRINPNDRYAKGNLATWQQQMARLGRSTSLTSSPPPSTEQPVVDAEPPASSAVVILSPLKHKPEATTDNNPANNPAPKTDEFAGTEGQENTPAKNGQNAKASANDSPVEKYYEYGSDSGAKILPKKQEETAAPTIDQSMNRLETKIYGQPGSETSVLKRLERMELDSFGKVSSGAINERIDRLKKYFNLTN